MIIKEQRAKKSQTCVKCSACMDVGGTCRRTNGSSHDREGDLLGEEGSREWAWFGVNEVKVGPKIGNGQQAHGNMETW